MFMATTSMDIQVRNIFSILGIAMERFLVASLAVSLSLPAARTLLESQNGHVVFVEVPSLNKM